MAENDWSSENVSGRRKLADYLKLCSRLQVNEQLVPSKHAIDDEYVAEKSLWATCLLQAFTKDGTALVKKKPASRRNKTNSRYRSLDAWLSSTSEEVGSYLFICDVLGLDPERTREAGLLLKGVLSVAPRNGRKAYSVYAETISIFKQ